jgi:hypothetical protein
MLSVSVNQATPVAPPGVPDQRRLTRRHVKQLAALVAGAAVLVGGGLGVRWWTHPDELTPQNAGGTMWFGPRPLNTSRVTFALTFPERSADATTVMFRSTPVVDFATNTAHARVTLGICHPRPGIPDNTAIGSVRGTGRHYCGSIETVVDGTRFTIRGADYLIATITPTTPGRVVITAMDFNYAMGRADWFRRGVDHLGMHVVMRRIS